MILGKGGPKFTLKNVMVIFGQIWLLIPIMLLATGWLYILVLNAPDVCSDHKLGFPSSLEELKKLAALLSLYYETSPTYVVVLFSSAFLYKQSFSIPGSVFLNVLGGALFGVVVGFPLCCLLTSCGASCCFAISKYLSKDAVQKVFPDKVKYFQMEVEKHKDHILYYLLFLRLFPMSPNWLINLVAPVIGIPYHLFLVTATFGLMPYVFVCVQTGEMLASITSLDSIFSYTLLFKMALLALAALGPSIFLKRKLSATVHPHDQ